MQSVRMCSTDFLGFCICANVWVGCVFSTNEMFHVDDFKKINTDNPFSGSRIFYCHKVAESVASKSPFQGTDAV